MTGLLLYCWGMETNALLTLRGVAATLPDLGFPTFIVGGCVRDALLDVRSKDIDLAVEAPSFDHMLAAILEADCEVFDLKPEFLTVRGKPSRGPALDFVLCRSDGVSSDGRRPDFVSPGTITDDLARRDFTVNAIALDCAGGELLDPFDGVHDLRFRYLRFVGKPEDRITEDGLRVLRGFRFMVTKGLRATLSAEAALFSPLAATMLGKVSVERIRDELVRMMQSDTLRTLDLLSEMSDDMRKAIFRDGLRLDATLRG